MSVDEMVIKWSMDSKGFNDGLTKMNKSMSLLKSEFSATASKLKVFGNSTDQLKNKQEYLTKAMDIQKSKIDVLKNSYDKQVQATGENSREAQNLAIKLNNQIAYYNKLETELQQTNKELEMQTSKWNKLSTSLSNASKKVKDFGSKLSSIGNTLTLGVTAPLTAIGVAGFNAASDMDESINKVQVACGNGANKVIEFSKTTLKSFGIAKGSALDMMATFSDMGTGMGLEQQKANEMSMSLVGLAGDLASFKNIRIDVAKTALNSIYTGETESLKQLGIVMTQTNLNEFARQQGMKKTIDKMTQAEQVQLRYAYVMEKTKNAQGDFARTSDGAANQQRIFTESLKELSATFGQHLLPVITPCITKLNELLQKFGSLDEDTQKNIVKFGALAIAIGPVTKVLGGLCSGISKTLDFTANLDKKFDKLKSTCVGVGKNLKTVGTAMLNGAKYAGNLALNIGKTVVQFTKQAAITAASTVKLVSHKIATAAATLATNAMKAAQSALNFVMNLNPITLVITGLVALGATFTILYNKCEWFRNGVNEIWSTITGIFTNFDNFLTGIFTIDWTNNFGVLGNIFNSFFANVSNYWEAIKNVFSGVIDFVAGVFTLEWSRAWEGVKNIFGGIMDGLGAVIKAPLNTVIGLINMAIDGLNTISFTAPDWVPIVGGKHFGVDLPKINYLYEGGIIDRPTFLNSNTVVGDSYKGLGRQAEAVIPLAQMYSNLRKIVKEEAGAGQTIIYTTNIFKVDGKEMYRETTRKVVNTINRSTNNYKKGKGGFAYG